MLTNDTATIVPQRDKASLTRGTTEARFYKGKANIARRHEDGAAIAEALALHEDDDFAGLPWWMGGTNDGDYLWVSDDATWDDPDFDLADSFCAKHPNGDCWDDEQDRPTIDLYGSLLDDMPSDLTVTQMFYGDYTNDDPDALGMWIPGVSAL